VATEVSAVSVATVVPVATVEMAAQEARAD
jgi:hypothetical protein